MKYYMIVDSQDYADEFDYPILSTFNEAELAEFRAVEEGAIEKGLELGIEREVGFGTNEAFNMSIGDMINYVISAQEITKEEYNFVNNNGFIGLDVFDYCLEMMSEAMGEA